MSPQNHSSCKQPKELNLTDPRQPFGDGWLWLSTDKPVNQLSVLKDQHRGNTLNLKLGSDSRVFIDIKFGNPISSIRFRSQLIHDWANHAAGSAPGRPTINQHRYIAGTQHVTLKRGVRDHQRLLLLRLVRDVARIQWGATFSTLRLADSDTCKLNPILSPTFATANYRHAALLSFEMLIKTYLNWPITQKAVLRRAYEFVVTFAV
jgi:hypothetical protein